jgi:hypothetical protein
MKAGALSGELMIHLMDESSRPCCIRTTGDFSEEFVLLKGGILSSLKMYPSSVVTLYYSYSNPFSSAIS